MQKFGLRVNHLKQHSAFELEIAREQASALGRSGRKLRLVLEQYQIGLEDNYSLQQIDVLIDNISDAVWNLVLQREFIGFTDGNIDWIKKYYNVPQHALNRLGKTN